MKLTLAALLSVCATVACASDAREARLSEILESTRYPGQPDWAIRSVDVAGTIITDRLSFQSCRQVRDTRSSTTKSNLCFAEASPPSRALQKDGWVQLLYPISEKHRPRIRAQKRLHQRLLDKAYDAYPGMPNQRIPFLAESLERNLSYPDFSFSRWEIEYCDGSLVSRPNSDEFFFFYVKEELVDEFIALLDDTITDHCALPVS